MPAQTANLTIEQGATFRQTFFVKAADGAARDLTGFSARMQVRATIDTPTPAASLTSPAGGLTITAATGRIDALITAADTAAMTFSRAVYDLELVNGAEVERAFSGFVTLSREVTR